MNVETQEPPQITLFFEGAVIFLLGTAEEIRAKRIDFAPFGTFIAGEGEDWESVVRGSLAVKEGPTDG